MKRIAIVGASIGGILSSKILAQKGHEVHLIEKGSKIGGLYSHINTPMGKKEIGMHVLYLSKSQLNDLIEIFGKDSFYILNGINVDIGGNYLFNKINSDSVYPDLKMHKKQKDIYRDILSKNSYVKENASQYFRSKFGVYAEENIYSPILLNYGNESSKLTDDASHCFYDLRRVVICSKRC